MIVVDASVAVAGLLAAGDARTILGDRHLQVPHLIDSEVASAVRRSVLTQRIGAEQGWAAVATWVRLGVTRHQVTGLVPRVWALRENLTAYDATYVALAEALGCELVTADARLARAPGISCLVTVVPG